jgi:hypothetical protein
MNKKDIKRLDDLRDAEAKRVNERFALETAHVIDIRVAEARTIAAAERADSKSAALAVQVAASAETLRTLVASVKSTQDIQLAQLTTLLTDRLTSLEKTKDQSSGKSGGAKDIGGWIVGGIMLLVAVGSFLLPHLK